MKKTLVALAVLASAGSAQAIELYNADKVTVNMTGEVEVVYKKGLDDGAEFKQDIDEAKFGFDTRYAMNDDLQVGAFWEFDGSDTNDDTQIGDVYMGLYSASVGSIKFGKQATALDDAGIGGDYQFGISSFFQNGTPFAGHEVVKYELDQGTFYGTLAYMQDKNGYNGLGNDGNFFDLKLGGRVADFDFTGFFGQASIKKDATSAVTSTDSAGDTTIITPAAAAIDTKERIYALEARYAGVENLNLAAGYYGTEIDPAGEDKVKNQTFGLSADYALNAWTFGGGVSNTKLDEKVGDKDDFTAWYVNAAYALAPSTNVYAEVGGNNFYSQDSAGEYIEAKTQTGFAVGINATF